MQWVPVKSNWVQDVAYQDNSLFTRLRDGSTYRYLLVPQFKYQALIQHDSAGTYINEEIKPHHEVVEI